MIVNILHRGGVEEAQARLVRMGCRCHRFSADTIRDLDPSSSELVYLVPEQALETPDWPEVRVKLAQACRYYVVIGKTMDSARIMRAARDGAFDVLLLEDSEERWSSALAGVVASQCLWLRVYGSAAVRPEGLLLGESNTMRSLRRSIERLGPTGATVLIQGESGVGKELVARMLHQTSGRGPFVAVNCAAIPKGLIEAELFGAEKGAYTGSVKTRPGLVEQADGGTLFLDEIGELEMSLQPKLLRFLETRHARRVGGANEYQVSVHLLSASNVQLDEAVANSQFRADLYYRLCEVTLHVPPLRAHPEDIGALAMLFARQAGERFGKHFESVEPELIVRLQQYDWPGNVRQLKSVIDRMVILYDGPALRAGWWETPHSSPPRTPAAVSAPARTEPASIEPRPGGPPASFPSRKQKLDMARRLLADGELDLTAVAAQLGVNISTLYRWRKSKTI